jgi:hypothetical protein
MPVPPPGALPGPGAGGRDGDAWSTVSGGVSAHEIEAACARLGVRFDRARRTYWQRERLFPLSARRDGHPRAQGRFHPGAAELAVVGDACLARGLPNLPRGARSSLVPLRDLLADWWKGEMATASPERAESRFYRHVARVAERLRRGQTPGELRRPLAGAPG